MKDDQAIKDLASYVARTNTLDDKDRLRLALALIKDSDIPVRPEVTSYLREAINN